MPKRMSPPKAKPSTKKPPALAQVPKRVHGLGPKAKKPAPPTSSPPSVGTYA